MKIRMLDSESDRHSGTVVRYRAGQVYDVPRKVGERWVEIGLAERVKKTGGTTKKGRE